MVRNVKLFLGPIALGKVLATQTFKFCADEALQIFGGRGYTRGGEGEKVILLRFILKKFFNSK